MFSHRSFSLVLVAAVALAASCDRTSTSPAGDVVLRGNACRTCTIVAESIAYLGHPDDTLALRQELLPAVDSRGRYYLADRVDGTMLAFAPGGRLLTRFGKRGSGPAEFQRISVIVASAADTLLVLAGGSVHVISPDYEHVRQFADPQPGPASFDFTMLRDGRLLRQGSAPNSFGLTTASGENVGQTILQGVDTTYNCGECGRRVFRESRAGGTVWSGPFNQYVVEEHTLDGTFLRRISREAAWFAPWGDEPRGSDEIAEFSVFRLIGALQSADGILFTHTAGIGNPDSLRKVIAASGATPPDEAQLFQLMTTHIEAIDPDRGRLLGHLALPGLVLPLQRDYAAQLVVDPSGDWAWRILKFRLADE
jgi:hypothetical protein